LAVGLTESALECSLAPERMAIQTLVVAALSFTTSAARWHGTIARRAIQVQMNEDQAAALASDQAVAAFAAAESARAAAEMATMSEEAAEAELRAAGLYDDIEEVMGTDGGLLPSDAPFGAGKRKLSLPSMEEYYAGAPGTGSVEWTAETAAAAAEAAELEAMAAAEAAETAMASDSATVTDEGEGDFMQVICPMELGLERTLRIQLPDGREFDVIVPDDVVPGGEFLVGPFPPPAA